jgi:hypothetical protein
MQAYQELIDKLDGFIRKYYLNQLVKGSILFVSGLLLSYLLVSTTEFFGHFNTTGRALLLVLFTFINGSLLAYFVLLPLARYHKLGKRISHEEAAVIIGRFFPDIEDKLLNTLQLQQEFNNNQQNDLLLASIDQRSKQLSKISFVSSIDLKKNKKYIRYLWPVTAVFLVVLFTAPSILTDAGKRVIQYNTVFVPQAPFQFLLVNDNLKVSQYSDLEIKLEITGDEIPADVYVEASGKRYKLEKLSKTSFKHVFRSLSEDVQFRFWANKFYSIPYAVKVLPKPLVTRFDVWLDYPAYVGKPDEQLNNTGDLVIPQGTRIRWNFQVKAVDAIQMMFDSDSSMVVADRQQQFFVVEHKAKQSSTYQIFARNKQNPATEEMRFSLNVVPDAYPSIQLEQIKDSTDQQLHYFSGEITDDYGFTALQLQAEIRDENNLLVKEIKQKLPLSKGLNQAFYHYLNIREFNLTAGQQLQYFFEVTDNDAVNGPKTARSAVFNFRQPTVAEAKKEINNKSESVVNQMKQALKEVNQLQQDAEKLKRKLQEQKQLSWEDKKLLEQIQKREQKLAEQLQEVSKDIQQQKEQKEAINPDEAAIFQKQEELKAMMDKLLNDDMKKLLDELQKMMQQEKQPELQQQLDQIKLDNKDIAKELDRMLSFFKAMEVEQKLEQTIQDLNKLADKQADLAKENEKQQSNAAEATKKQDELNKEFESLLDEMKDLAKKNEELDQPMDLENMEEEGESIEQDMQEAGKQLQQKKQQAGSQKQKQAADKMKSLASKLQMQMNQAQKEQLELDIRAVRQLLENLVKFSFAQEALIDRLRDNTNYSQVYVDIAKDQAKLREDASLIEDSLLALSKRVMQLQSFVNKEVSDLNEHLQRTVDFLSNRQTPQARSRQQYAMTSANNLAVMLSELLKNMQQQMAEMESKKGGGQAQCMKPGKSGQSSMSKLSKMQQELNQQLQRMKEGMKPGQQGKNGQSGQRGEQSKAFSEAVARQEAIRRELQKLNEEYNKDGKKSLGDLDKLSKEMEKTERELVNKILSQETLRRQQDIMTRLLESEKAERERDEEERRESESAKEKPAAVPPGFESYKRQKAKTADLYRTLTPELNSFYKKKVDSYFLELNR